MARLERRLAQTYAEWWADNGVSHELTLSLGYHPCRYEPESFLPILKRVVRETARKVRGIPKRKAARLQGSDPETPYFAGFFEGRDSAGLVYPHWHGVVALHAGEEPIFRGMLWECFGGDAQDPLPALSPTRTTRPLITDPRAKPTFHLTPLTTTERYIRYATKYVDRDSIVHWTSGDMLA